MKFLCTRDSSYSMITHLQYSDCQLAGKFAGQETRYTYAVAFDKEDGHLGSAIGLVKFDLGSPDEPVAATLRFGSGRTGGEAVFVPSSLVAAELKGKHLMPPLKPHSSKAVTLIDTLMAAMQQDAITCAHCLADAAAYGSEALRGVLHIKKTSRGANALGSLQTVGMHQSGA